MKTSAHYSVEKGKILAEVDRRKWELMKDINTKRQLLMNQPE